MEIESFADSGNDIGSDVQEVQDSDMDFGDGDGVNEFDEDYNEMKMETEQKLEDFDYSETSKEVSAEQIQPQEIEQNPEEASLKYLNKYLSKRCPASFLVIVISFILIFHYLCLVNSSTSLLVNSLYSPGFNFSSNISGPIDILFRYATLRPIALNIRFT